MTNHQPQPKAVSVHEQAQNHEQEVTLYLIRHAQSSPNPIHGFAGWRLTPLGTEQAERLADLLWPLGIQQIFSSPFIRTLDTATPFAKKHALEIVVVDDLRERLIVDDDCHPSDEVWHKSWEDFRFALPGCEPSSDAQSRILRAMAGIAQQATGTSAIFTHGNVIGLFLNSLTDGFGRRETEVLTNPDVIKIGCKGGRFTWDRHFRLAGLNQIATAHNQTPKEQLQNS
jgi:2,3-bisphosphoglycerate-dependent phosphoglycerate mutase